MRKSRNTRKLLIKTTNYTNFHVIACAFTKGLHTRLKELFFIETKTLKTLTLYVLGFSALCDARHLFFL